MEFLFLLFFLLPIGEGNNEHRQLGRSKSLNKLFPDYPHLAKSYNHDYFGTYPVQTPPAMPIPYPVPVPGHDHSPSSSESDIEDTYPPARPPQVPEYDEQRLTVFTEAEYRCPESFTMVERKCTRYDKKPSKLGCKRGWSFQDGACIGVDLKPSGYTCDPNYHVNPKSKTCTKPIHAPMQVQCPVGFSLGKEKCFRLNHTEPDFRCPFGFIRHEKECLRIKEVSAEATCAPGYELIGSTCRRESILPGRSGCPMEFNFHNGECVKVIYGQKLEKCPAHYTNDMNGNCIHRKSIAASPSCLNGGSFDGEVCIITFDVTPSYECPHYAASKGGECYKESIVQPEAKCKTGHFSHSSGKCLYKKKKFDAIVSCPLNYKQIDQHSCYKKELIQAAIKCPHDYLPNEHLGKCTSTKQSPPTWSCPAGFELQQGMRECHAIEVQQVQQACEAGFTFNQHTGGCENLHKVHSIVDCEEGYAQTPTGECSKVEAFFPDVRCPANFEAKDGVCITEEYESLIFECPPNYEREEHPTGKPRCIGREELDARFECTQGFSQDESGKCVSYENHKPRKTCPEGYKYASEKCIRHMEESPAVMCPLSYKLFENVCINQIFAKAIPICPGGYKYDKLVHQCYKIETKYGFKNPVAEQLLDMDQTTTPQPREQLLDLEEPRSTTEPPQEQYLPQQQYAPMQQAPQQIQIVQQRIPIPSPVVYIPRQAPLPPPPLPRAPQPMPYPVPVPYSVPKPVAFIHEKPVPVAVKVPVHHEHTVVAQPKMSHKKNIFSSKKY